MQAMSQTGLFKLLLAKSRCSAIRKTSRSIVPIWPKTGSAPCHLANEAR